MHQRTRIALIAILLLLPLAAAQAVPLHWTAVGSAGTVDTVFNTAAATSTQEPGSPDAPDPATIPSWPATTWSIPRGPRPGLDHARDGLHGYRRRRRGHGGSRASRPLHRQHDDDLLDRQHDGHRVVPELHLRQHHDQLLHQALLRPDHSQPDQLDPVRGALHAAPLLSAATARQALAPWRTSSSTTASCLPACAWRSRGMRWGPFKSITVGSSAR